MADAIKDIRDKIKSKADEVTSNALKSRSSSSNASSNTSKVQNAKTENMDLDSKSSSTKSSSSGNKESTKIKYENGNKVEYHYYEDGSYTKDYTDKSGNRVIERYDDNNKLTNTRTIDSSGTERVNYDDGSRIVETKNNDGTSTIDNYGKDGSYSTSKIQKDGTSTKKYQNSEGNTTIESYDSNGKIINTKTEYADGSYTVEKTSSNGTTTIERFDKDGNRTNTRTIDSSGKENVSYDNPIEGILNWATGTSEKIHEYQKDKIEGVLSGVGSAVEGIGEAISGAVSGIGEGINEFSKHPTESITGAINDLINDPVGTLRSAGCTAVEGVSAIANGVGNLAESIIDLGAMVEGLEYSGVAQAADIASIITSGNEAGAYDTLWNGVFGFTGIEGVNYAFEQFYTGTDIGQTIDANSALKYGSDAYNLGVGATEIVGTIALTVLTGGGAGAAKAGGTAATRLGTEAATSSVSKVGAEAATKGLGKEAGTAAGRAASKEAGEGFFGTIKGLASDVKAGINDIGSSLDDVAGRLRNGIKDLTPGKTNPVTGATNKGKVEVPNYNNGVGETSKIKVENGRIHMDESTINNLGMWDRIFAEEIEGVQINYNTTKAIGDLLGRHGEIGTHGTRLTSSEIADVFTNGLYNNGNRLQGNLVNGNLVPDIGNTVKPIQNEIDLLYDLANQPFRDVGWDKVMIEYPKGLSNADIHYFDGERWRVKPEYIVGYIPNSPTTGIGEIITNPNWYGYKNL